MKIKKLLALALAGTMVFSMAACGDKKESDKEGAGSGKVTAESVIDKFDDFTKNMEKNYSSETYMKMKMTASGMEMDMEMTGLSTSYDGVTYTKSTTSMLGMKDVSEEYIITKEDGSVVEAYKSADDDEWEIDTYDAEDVEDTESTLDVEEIKKTAKLEEDGDNYIVTMEVDAEDMDISDEEMFEGAEDMKVKVIVTYNSKEEAITEIEIEFDLDVLTEALSALGEVEISELEMKITNIKKNDKAIEIPEEIELD